MRIYYRRTHIGMLAVVFALMAITLYMALAFPYSLMRYKQSETTEIQAVIIIGQHGEVTPPREAYFEANSVGVDNEPPEIWYELGGAGQLTNVGKERLYFLGKFLRLRYYERLLKGNPRKLFVRSENSDKCLESAQALIAGLNPPKDSSWLWSRATLDESFAHEWQPKAVHTTFEQFDDLLSSQTECLEASSFRQATSWKNSTRYAQLLNEFRHDLQILRQNTGLDFEDDLEMLSKIEEHLKARKSFDETHLPSWYTSTFADRLAHIADVTAGCRFSQATSQRLYAGRLLDTIVRNVFAKIRSQLTSGISQLNGNDNSNEGLRDDDNDFIDLKNQTNRRWSRRISYNNNDNNENLNEVTRESKLLPHDEQIKLKLAHKSEPNMFIFITDKQHLVALLNSLNIYANQPHFGAQLLIELHYDPMNQIHFLRLFTVNSLSHNVLPEPVRVNPIACLDSVECSPQKFERNIRHLTLDKRAWKQLCLSNGDVPVPPKLQQEVPSTTASSLLETTTTFRDLSPTERSDTATTSNISLEQSDVSTLASQITESTANEHVSSNTTPSLNIQPTSSDERIKGNEEDKNEIGMLVGPTNTRPISSGQTAIEQLGNAVSEVSSASEMIATSVSPTLIEIGTSTESPTTINTITQSTILESEEKNGKTIPTVPERSTLAPKEGEQSNTINSTASVINDQPLLPIRLNDGLAASDFLRYRLV